jgi:hypothetical protein
VMYETVMFQKGKMFSIDAGDFQVYVLHIASVTVRDMFLQGFKFYRNYLRKKIQFRERISAMYSIYFISISIYAEFLHSFASVYTSGLLTQGHTVCSVYIHKLISLILNILFKHIVCFYVNIPYL